MATKTVTITVVDTKTSKPIAGAAVESPWQVLNTNATIKLYEGTGKGPTGANGKFSYEVPWDPAGPGNQEPGYVDLLTGGTVTKLPYKVQPIPANPYDGDAAVTVQL